jgi:hypothetical protein
MGREFTDEFKKFWWEIVIHYLPLLVQQWYLTTEGTRQTAQSGLTGIPAFANRITIAIRMHDF